MKKLVALLTAAFMVAAMAVPAMADNYDDGTQATQGTSHGTVVEGGTVDLIKYLTMDMDAIVPEVTFEYELSVPESVDKEGDLDIAAKGEPGSTTEDYVAVEAEAEYKDGETYYSDDNGTVNDSIVDQASLDAAITAGEAFIKVSTTTDATVLVYVGINPELVEVIGVAGGPGELVFKPNDDDVNATFGTGPLENVADKTQKYVKKDIPLDFSGVTFKEPGIYRYYIQEKGNNPLVELDVKAADANKPWRTVDVYVVNDSDNVNANLVIASYVVYEGKVTAAPKEDIEYEYTDDKFDPKANLSGYDLTNKTWTYTGTDGTFVYKWSDKDGGWVETWTKTDGSIVVDTTKQQHLQEAKAPVDNETANTWDEAVAKGATDAQLRGYVWENTSPDGRVVEYTWNATDSKWKTAGSWDDTAEAPADGAKTYKDAAGDETNGNITYIISGEAQPKTVNKTYKEAVQDEQIVPTVLQSYTWRFVDTTSGAAPRTITYTYDSATGVWNTHTEVSEEVDAVPGSAVPKNPTPVTLSEIIFSYAEGQEKQAQSAANYGYDEALMENPNGAEASEPKNDVYVNNYDSATLRIAKTVTGNQGSKDKYFKFTVRIEREGAANLFIDADKNELDVAPTKNAATEYTEADMKAANGIDRSDTIDGYQYRFVAGTGATDPAYIEFDIYLQGGESITLYGVPGGSKYSVVEADYNENGYKSSATVTVDGVEEEFANDGSMHELHKDAEVEYTNEKNGVIPTGVAMGIGGAAILIAIAAIYFVIRRRTAYED